MASEGFACALNIDECTSRNGVLDDALLLIGSRRLLLAAMVMLVLTRKQ
jgi:hypothetical protein